MSISGISGVGNYSGVSVVNKKNTTANAGGVQQSDTGGTSATQEFMDYVKESPGQRMFDKWLTGKHISKEQFAAMSPAEKQKIIDEFKHEMERKLKDKLGANTHTNTVSVVV